MVGRLVHENRALPLNADACMCPKISKKNQEKIQYQGLNPGG